MSPRFIVISLVLASALVAGCDQRAPGPAASAPPISSAAAQEPPASGEDTSQGNGYAFHIRYPELQPEWRALDQALHAYAAARKQEFLDARKADDNSAGPVYNLDLEFNVVRRTADFVSVLTNGSVYTGGAHGMPIIASFNLHPADGKLVTIEDLFADPKAALKAVSDECRRQLEGRNEARLREGLPGKDLAAALKSMHEKVESGTEPVAANFSVFLVDGLDTKAIGLTLVFAPYQVGPYSDGAAQVEVPAKVFYALLRPEYREAFQIDTEAERLTPGAH